MLKASGPCCLTCTMTRRNFNDLGADPAHEAKRRELTEALLSLGPAPFPTHHHLGRNHHGSRRGAALERGVIIGVWDESEIADHYWDTYRGTGALIPKIETI